MEPTVTFPPQYRDICLGFLYAHFQSQREKFERNFMAIIPLDVYDRVAESPIAGELVGIARAATGEYPFNDDTADLMVATIDSLLFDIFAPDGMSQLFNIPDEFWQQPFGEMISRARLWCQGGELITQAEAAKLVGITIQAINQAIRSGHLRSFKNLERPRRQGRSLVVKSEVQQLYRSRLESKIQIPRQGKDAQK